VKIEYINESKRRADRELILKGEFMFQSEGHDGVTLDLDISMGLLFFLLFSCVVLIFLF
jgi:hypothetical protein